MYSVPKHPDPEYEYKTSHSWLFRGSRITAFRWQPALQDPARMSSDENSSEEPSLLSEAEAEPDEGPRCSRCNQVRSNEWINWQKCWSEPGVGGDGHSYVLVFPREGGPITLRVQGQGSFEDKDFWWFFICGRCRLIFKRGGLVIDHAEIEDRFHPGGKGKVAQMRPTFVPKNIGRDQWLDQLYEVGGFWTRSPPSPVSSDSSNPWAGHL